MRDKTSSQDSKDVNKKRNMNKKPKIESINSKNKAQ